MDSVINFFLALQEQFGFKAAVVIVIIGITIVAFWKKLLDLLIAFLHRIIQREFLKFNKNGLLRHPLFAKFKYLEKQRLKFLKCQCPLRKNIFSDLMIIRVKSMESILKDFICESEIGKFSESDFQFKLTSVVYDIFAKWEEEARKEGIPEVVMIRFLDNIQDIRDSLVTYIRTSANSYSNFNSNYAKVYALLDILSGFEELLIIRLEMELDNMNGEISKSEYKGMKCEHCQHCQSTKVKVDSAN